MSVLAVNDLPNEIIIQILQCVDQKNLRNASLACKLWRNLIESSCRWSTDLRCYRSRYRILQWTDFMLTTGRKFKTVKLEYKKPVNTNKMLEIFERHGTNIVKLHLKDCYINSFIEFAEILKRMPNLKHVIMDLTKTLCRASDVAVQDLPELKKLKTLDMVDSECSIIKCFQRSKLTTLKIHDLSTEHTLNSKLYKDFLKSQNLLTLLAIETIDFTSMQFLSADVPFHLTQLSLCWELESLPVDDYTNLLNFLEVQATTLKELELGRSTPSSVYESVFAKMTELETLSVMMLRIPSEMDFYNRLRENRSITNLILWDSAFYSEFAQKFFGKLPNIQSVTVPGCCNNETLRMMSQCFSKLESLVTGSLCGINSFDFPNLKRIQFECLDGTVDWRQFVKAHPQLSELTITTTRDKSLFNLDDFEQLTRSCSLRSLRLGRFFSADKRFFDIVRKSCPDLKVLDLDKLCLSNELKDNVKCNVMKLYDSISIQYGKFFTLLEHWSWY